MLDIVNSLEEGAKTYECWKYSRKKKRNLNISNQYNFCWTRANIFQYADKLCGVCNVRIWFQNDTQVDSQPYNFRNFTIFRKKFLENNSITPDALANEW